MEYLDFRLETVIEHRMRALQQCLVKPLSEKTLLIPLSWTKETMATMPLKISVR